MPQKRKFTDQQFLELYDKNLSLGQIAEILKVSKASVWRRMVRLKKMPKKPQGKSNLELSLEKLRANDKKQNQKPERLAAKKAYGKEYQKEYYKRPEVKTRRQAQRKVTEHSAKRKEYKKNYNRDYYKRPEVQAKRKARQQTPENKQKRKAAYLKKRETAPV
ncbi:MAG: HTH domain-containing protein [Candidatus Bathyarchaeia archaeon]|jgi:hypothetical protein